MRGNRVTQTVHLLGDVATSRARVTDAIALVRGRRLSPIETRQPWWPFAAIRYVADVLPPHAMVFEFGSGGSTLWLADQGAQVVSLEHDGDWYSEVVAAVPASVNVILCEPTQSGTVRSESAPGAFDAYVATISGYPDDSFDLVSVDGRVRVASGLAALGKVRPGGMLLLDDSDRPRYQGLNERCSQLGWVAHTFRGIKRDGDPRGDQTTVWRRPASSRSGASSSRLSKPS